MQDRLRTALLPAFLCLLLAQALSVQSAARTKKPKRGTRDLTPFYGKKPTTDQQ